MPTLATGQIRATFSTLGARLVSLDFAGADCVMGGGTDEEILSGDWTTGAIACSRATASSTRTRSGRTSGASDSRRAFRSTR